MNLNSTIADGNSWIHQCDGRVRLICALGLSITIALVDRPFPLTLAMSVGFLLFLASRISPGQIRGRFTILNTFLLALLLIVPFSIPGQTWFRVGPLTYSIQGFHQVLATVVKANAILLICTTLVGTLTPSRLAQTFQRLRVPNKLTVLFFLTARYVSVLAEDYQRIRWGMKMRGFEPDCSGRTLRHIGFLTGNILLRSFDRSERVLQAMHCRGFNDRFPAPRTAARLGSHDLMLFSVGTVIAATIVCLEWFAI